MTWGTAGAMGLSGATTPHAREQEGCAGGEGCSGVLSPQGGSEAVLGAHIPRNSVSEGQDTSVQKRSQA